jgi:ribosomal-protein-alanine N-acetyltransferase
MFGEASDLRFRSSRFTSLYLSYEQALPEPTVARDPLPEIIHTHRLRLRPWELTDVDEVLSYAQDPEWSRFLRILPQPYTRADAEKFVARQRLLDWQDHPSWAITLGGAVIGGINLRFSFENRLAEVGYSVARALWNQGFTSEAAAAVIDAAFTTHADLNRVHARADQRNAASQRVMEKVGMVKEGILRQSRVERDQAVDEAWWGILRNEWTARRADG